eukprot:gene12782-16040_t
MNLPLLLLSVIFLARFGCSRELESFHVHTFSLSELQEPSQELRAKLEEAVFNHGIFAVTDAFYSGADELPKLEERTEQHQIHASRKEDPFAGALSTFMQCAASGKLSGKLKDVVLDDGNIRSTLAIATNASVHYPLPENVTRECPALAQTSDKLREAVDSTGRAYAAILDSLLHPELSSASAPYEFRRPISSAMEKSESLEHFHVFHGPKEDIQNSKDGENAAIELHTDMGLFLVMSAAEYFSTNGPNSQRLDPNNGKPESGFILQLPDGRMVKPIIPDGSLLVMNGEGCTRWSWPGHSAEQVQASRAPHPAAHEVVLPQLKGISRAWFGRMYLPPRSSLLVDTNMSFNEYRQQTYSAFHEGTPDLALTTGCSRNARKLADEDLCGANEVYCWMSCIAFSSDIGCSKSDVQCADPTGAIWPNEFINPGTGDPDHCYDCGLSCPAIPGGNSTSPPSRPSTGFCNTRLIAISMWMTGFQFSGKSTDPCVIYLFPEWVLDTKVKFAFACIGTFFMGIACLSLAYAIAVIKRKRRASHVQSVCPNVEEKGGLVGTPPAPPSQHKQMKLLWELLIVLLYAIQMTLAYWLMLLAMTYQAELFIMTVAGLATGYWIFNLYLEEEEAENNDPCCV